MNRLRLWLAPLALCVLTACAQEPPPLDLAPEPIGAFRMGFPIVVANDAQKGPASREATEDELAAAVEAAVTERLDRYDGDGLYHVGLRVEAYVLAQPGIPVIFSPQSVMLLALNVWDNATQERLNEEPIRITAFEGGQGGGPFVPSGLINSREKQLANLARTAARQVEVELRKRADDWFVLPDDHERVAFDRTLRDRSTGDADAEASAQEAASGN